MDGFTGLIIGLLVGFMFGVYIMGDAVNSAFNGEYDKAAYEWKLKKEGK